MIRKIDGRTYLDSGTVIVSGDAVAEIDVKLGNHKHEVALKFRSLSNEQTGIKFGDPREGRTVVHFVNFPRDSVSSAPGVHIGKISNHELRLAFVIEPFSKPPEVAVWRLTYTLYAGLK